ncbi:hypothetical protein GJ496_005739 [Pomphorhynchus laevis]|nr:hypothetical protein GJ496_005739 [Pomphorhynchus laevis]
MANDFEVFKRYLQNTIIHQYPRQSVKTYDILFRQTGFIVDSTADMNFLCHRTALVAAIRSINLGASVGIMIATSNGPWYRNGIILIDANGSMFPRKYITLAEQILNFEEIQTLRKIAKFIEDTDFPLKDEVDRILSKVREIGQTTHFQNQIVERADIPEKHENLKESELFIKNHAFERRDTATVLIGYDTRARNHAYALIILQLCIALDVKCYCVGYTTTPLLSYIVLARNGRLYKQTNLPNKDDYVKQTIEAMMLLGSICTDANSTISYQLGSKEYHDKNMSPANVFVDTANSVVTPFIFQILKGLTRNDFFCSCHVYNTRSVELYHEEEHEAPFIRIIDTSHSNPEHPIRLWSSNGREVNLAIESITSNCGSDFVNEHKFVPIQLYFLPHELYKSASHCCSFDGDGDKLVFYYKDASDDITVNLLNGDRIAVLYVKFIKSLFNRIHLINPEIVVFLNSFSNTASAQYISRNFGVHVIRTIDCPLKMSATAKTFAVCIYFTVNGHGNVFIQQQIINKVLYLRRFLYQANNCKSTSWKNLKDYNNYKKLYGDLLQNKEDISDKLEACDILMRLFNLLNWSSSDALKHFFAIEFILAYAKLGLRDWYSLYKDIPSYEIYWNPDSDISAYLSHEELSTLLLTFNRSTTSPRNVQQSIKQKLIRLMLIAGTRRCGDMDTEALLSDEMLSLRSMNDVEYKQYIELFDTLIDLQAISELWKPKYKFIAQNRFLYCLYMILQDENQQNLRIIICPNENGPYSKIYVESVSVPNAKAIALKIFLLMRAHVQPIIPPPRRPVLTRMKRKICDPDIIIY